MLCLFGGKSTSNSFLEVVFILLAQLYSVAKVVMEVYLIDRVHEM